MRIDIPGKGPIEFEGQKLSDAAKYFEFVPGYQIFPADSKKWILDLHYAWAKGRSADSDVILRTCRLIETASRIEQPSLIEKARKSFPKISTEEFLKHWFESLAVISQTAAQREVCYWIIRPMADEVDLFLQTSIKVIQNNKGYERVSKEFKQRLETIRHASEAEKIRFILDFTDSYSDSE